MCGVFVMAVGAGSAEDPNFSVVDSRVDWTDMCVHKCKLSCLCTPYTCIMCTSLKPICVRQCKLELCLYTSVNPFAH